MSLGRLEFSTENRMIVTLPNVPVNMILVLFYWLTETVIILCCYTIYIELSAEGSVSHRTTNCK